jgi:hypothetical protein
MYYDECKATAAAKCLLRDNDQLVRVLVIYNRFASNYSLSLVFDEDEPLPRYSISEIVEREETVYA